MIELGVELDMLDFQAESFNQLSHSMPNRFLLYLI